MHASVTFLKYVGICNYKVKETNSNSAYEYIAYPADFSKWETLYQYLVPKRSVFKVKPTVSSYVQSTLELWSNHYSKSQNILLYANISTCQRSDNAVEITLANQKLVYPVINQSYLSLTLSSTFSNFFSVSHWKQKVKFDDMI